MAWNGYRHFELYYSISGIGAVCHTINPRLSAEQMIYIVNHAEDEMIFVDTTFVPILEAVKSHLRDGITYVILTDRAHMPENSLGALCYEELLAEQPDTITWPEFDENTAAGLCYTSGTTGHPQRRALFQPLDGSARALCRDDTRAVHSAGIENPASGSAVSRQRVEPALFRPAHGSFADHAGRRA